MKIRSFGPVVSPWMVATTFAPATSGRPTVIVVAADQQDLGQLDALTRLAFDQVEIDQIARRNPNLFSACFYDRVHGVPQFT